MPVFKLDIQSKTLNDSEFWTNVFYVLATDLADAASMGGTLSAALASVMLNKFVVDRHRVSTLTEGDEEYITTPVNLLGERADTGNTWLPLFNVVVCELLTGVTRPGLKYLRGILAEEDISEGTVIGGTRTLVQNALTNAIVAGVQMCERDGSLVGFTIPKTKVGNRQLRRGSRRRTTPVIP